MRKIYTITFVSSLVQALVSGVLLWATGPFVSARGYVFEFGAALAGIAVWMGFFVVLWAIRKRVQPTLGLAIGVGSGIGVLSALLFCFLCGINPVAVPIEFLTVCVFGVLFGVLLSLINYALWMRIGFIQLPIYEPDDVIYQRVFREAAELAAGQEGVWPPPPQRPDGNLQHR